MWRKPYHVKHAEQEGILYLTCEWEGVLYALQPVCDPSRWEEAVEVLRSYFAEQDTVLYFTGIEKAFAGFLAEKYAGKFDIQADRDNFDYVYLADKLITLSGRKLHSKKNHLNAFRKLYPEAEYQEITPEILPACRAELEKWYADHIEAMPESVFIPWERDAILELFEDWDYFQLKGGAICLNGKIIAFTFGEQLNSDSVVVHVEKADPNIRGAYPAINQGFIEHEWSGMTYINREEDMGQEGLRKAKESYKPEKMIEKYNAKYIAD
ncbi:hypothetical protein SAMN05216582_10419 [Selenomonas ruminantium]|uniref:Phosphatidylglycerol lysyltransferase C-terminal domain-containing protein n=2 Tax=Selenomonas ruminantium TaxID=971 RepID=A0A1M6SDN0_SELRU|nr:hypothetical protein SAMN05216582_10419 [Selenomonas ruminantium]